ncbi:Methyl viologen resistance protein SmvA [Pseudovibrio axinellae]|uniref:Methyl viologen resistance protein SmvA n=1 Tax=Pseudovibrio axinellae TaxID=989403 RepID=A0A166APG5_9HYPH|nr:MFS transporter [Pseudovibrio axinellae]KZL21382.1 Methyl viologen resistance protein SmvA [Pseudovibrio axinellae]SEQ98163.1 drug resistance transporter, EmrB/QacA subfamily [Pseudovibrio axinellae]
MLDIPVRFRNWIILGLVSALMALILLDESVFGPALPTIQSDLGLSRTATHWVINAYLLVFSSSVALGGKLRDMYGLHVLVGLGGSFFLIGSLLGGASQSEIMIIIARASQGLGAGMLYPVVATTITATFPAKQHGMALGVMASTGTTFLALGPLLGGVLTEYASWRWVFWFNVPLISAIWCAIALILPHAPITKKTQEKDWLGLSLLLFGLLLFVYGIMEAPVGGSAQLLIVAAIPTGLAVLSFFYWFESKARSPLIDVRVLKNLSITACCTTTFAAQYCKLTVTIFIALYCVKVLELSPLKSGLATFVCVSAAPITAPFAGRIADKYGSRRPVLLGLFIAGTSLFAAAICIQHNLLYPTLAVLFIWGITLPFCYVPSVRLTMNQTTPSKRGEVLGIFGTARIMGGTIGIAVSSMILSLTQTYDAVFFTGSSILGLSFLFALFFMIAKESEGSSGIKN